ncbi:putative methyltransferase [Arthrobacter sp. SO5]|uniref:class I SAM-dependent methyltransferase n=1 Tax=Arthrobacter sp. SO5 TaxID=1897055 RepID=UPI001E3E681E|nr:class I SAM-dependent methyltransferase [Arthrobacter sp. SO5]MCB5275340.1 putative methyltransferase [Arthrobacter sp. SO5]
MTLSSDVRGTSNWAGKGPPYSRSFAHLCAGAIVPLLDAIEDVIGEIAGKRLADVGCGTGTLSARAAGRGASVTGVDPDAEMLSLARATAPEAALCVGAVPDLPFEPGTFDAVVANFVVNHVGDPRAAVADLMRVCVPYGVVGVTVWPSKPSAINALWADVIKASGADTPPPQHLPPTKDFERTEHGLAELLTGAGFGRVEATTLTWEFRIDAEDLWAGPAGGVGGIGKVVTSQTPAMQSVMRREYERLVSPMVRSGQVVLPAVALLATGQASASDRSHPVPL